MKYGPVYEWYFMHFSQRKMIIDDDDFCQENNVRSYISMTLQTFHNFLVTILIIYFYREKSNQNIDIFMGKYQTITLISCNVLQRKMVHNKT